MAYFIRVMGESKRRQTALKEKYGQETRYITSKAEPLRYSTRKPNKTEIVPKDYETRHFQQFLTPKTNISTSKGKNHLMTEISPIGANVTASSTTAQPLKPLKGKTINVVNAA